MTKAHLPMNWGRDFEPQYLRDSETCSGESGNEVTFEHSLIVLGKPVENGEDVHETDEPSLLPLVAPELAEGIVRKECLHNSLFHLGPEGRRWRKCYGVNHLPDLAPHARPNARGGRGPSGAHVIRLEPELPTLRSLVFSPDSTPIAHFKRCLPGTRKLPLDSLELIIFHKQHNSCTDPPACISYR